MRPIAHSPVLFESVIPQSADIALAARTILDRVAA